MATAKKVVSKKSSTSRKKAPAKASARAKGYASMFSWAGEDEDMKKKKSKKKIWKLYQPIVLKASKRQTGESDAKSDKARTALPAGKRMSKSGKTYYEYRRNRTDVAGRKK